MKGIKKIALGLVICLVFSAVPAYASMDVITLLPFPVEATINEDTMVLTLEEAFQLARRNNSSIDALNDAIINAEQQRRLLTVDHDNAWRFGMGLLDHSAAQLRRAIDSIDQASANVPAQTRMIETVSDFLVLNSINTIRSLEIDIIMLREGIALDAVSLNHAELRNRLGMASSNEVAVARQTLEIGRSRLRALNMGLESQRAGLNHLLGLPSDADVVIEHNFSLELGSIAERVGNIQMYTDRQIARDPSLQILRRQLENAQHNYDNTQNWLQNAFQARPDQILNREANATDRANMLNAINTASRDLRDATDNTRENIRNSYNQLRQLEEQHEALLMDLQSVHYTYNATKVRYAAGMATQHDVNSLRLFVILAESHIIKNALSYELLLFTFESPFLLNR